MGYFNTKNPHDHIYFLVLVLLSENIEPSVSWKPGQFDFAEMHSIAFWIPGWKFALIDAPRLTRGRVDLAPVRHIEFELTAAEPWEVSPV